MPNWHKLSSMDLRHLRTFVTVAEQGTVSKAALSLHVAQPALSRQIKDLEVDLGLKLFDRVRRRLVLTAEGERLLTDCRNILSAVDALGERVQLLRRPDAGVLRIAATSQVIDSVLSEFLHRYAKRCPDVQIKLREGTGRPLLAMLEHGEIHLTIVGIRAIQAENHPFGIALLPPVEFLAAFKPSIELAKTASIDIRRLGAHPLLLLDTSFFFRLTFDAACRIAGFHPNIFLEGRSPHALLSLAESGHGVAIVPSVQTTQRYRLRIARLTYERKPLREPYAILWDKRRALPPFAEDFRQSLAAYMREIFPISRPLSPKGRRRDTLAARPQLN
jgi:DNA-binding transcriptional LysR family regulator